MLAGADFGDHCSPISDTTILSSTGASCNVITHVTTQLPCALIGAIGALSGYVVFALTLNGWLGFDAMVVVLLGLGLAASGAITSLEDEVAEVRSAA